MNNFKKLLNEVQSAPYDQIFKKRSKVIDKKKEREELEQAMLDFKKRGGKINTLRPDKSDEWKTDNVINARRYRTHLKLKDKPRS